MIKEVRKSYRDIGEEKNAKEIKAKKVKCPVCTNKRLFDVINAYQAEIEIKCPKCGSKINIFFESHQINVTAV